MIAPPSFGRSGASGADAPGSSLRRAFPPSLSPVLILVLAACGGDDDLEQPAPLYGEAPIEYPMELWDQDIEGMTLLRVRVDEMGVVDSAEVLETSGHPAFDSAALNGARDLRFSPARKGGERVKVWAEVPVHFSKDPDVPGRDAPSPP